MCVCDKDDASTAPSQVPAPRRPEPLGSRLVWWIVIVGIFSFFAGLMGVAFSTASLWDESYTPPSCFELVDELDAGWQLLAVFAGPVLMVVALVATATKAATADRTGLAVAFSSRLVGTGLAVIVAAPISAYVLIDAGYRAGIHGEYKIADRATCVAQLLPGSVVWSTLAIIVVGSLTLGRTMVSYQ